MHWSDACPHCKGYPEYLDCECELTPREAELTLELEQARKACYFAWMKICRDNMWGFDPTIDHAHAILTHQAMTICQLENSEK